MCKNAYCELAPTKVKDLMTSDIVIIEKSKPLTQAAHTMIGSHVSCLVVVQDTKPVGIITERDFIKKLPMGKESKGNLLVKDLMTSKVVLVDPETSLFEAHKIMRKNGFRKLVVAQKGTVQGIITQTDLCRAVLKLDLGMPKIPTVNDVMTRKPLEVSPEDSFSQVKKLMAQKDLGSVIVTEKGEMRGIFTEFDIVSEFFINPNRLKFGTMKELMSSPVICVTPEFDLLFVNKLMIEKGFRRLPVIMNDKIVGIITQTDVARAIYEHMERGKDEKKVLPYEDQKYELVKSGNMILYKKK